jgi:hypothetical protein
MNLTIKEVEALIKLNSAVSIVRGDVAYDADGNEVSYDKAAVQAYVDAHAYIAKRQAEYPPIGDQLDALWKGGEAAAEMLAKVQAVKTKFPKGTV